MTTTTIPGAEERRLTDPMHHPGAHVLKQRVVVDGDYDGLVWGTRWVVVIPGIGSVGEWDRPDHARKVCAAYLTLGATRETILQARAACGCTWAAAQLGGRAP